MTFICDNQATFHINKYIEIDYHFIKKNGIQKCQE